MCGHKQYMFFQFIGVATNSTHITHEVLAGVVSEGLVPYIKGEKKFVKKVVTKLFVPSMRGICLGTQLLFYSTLL